MNKIYELYVEKGKSLLALGEFGAIALNINQVLLKNQGTELHKRVLDMCSNLPDHLFENNTLQIEEFKLVRFVYLQSHILMISEVEGFIKDLLIEVLCLHPNKLGKNNIELNKLLEFGSIDTAIRYLAEGYLNKIMYKRPNEYKREIISLLSMEEDALDSVWPIYVEAKARRDLGIHNSWKTNDIYLSKLKEVGINPPEDNKVLIDIDYFNETRRRLFDLISLIFNHCKNKFFK